MTGKDVFAFIFSKPIEKKNDKNNFSRKKFKEEVKSITSNFEDAVADWITDIVFDNLDYLADIIIKNDPHKLARENTNILSMLLESDTSSKILEISKASRRYIRWDTKTIFKSVLELLESKGIVFSKDEKIWLAKNIHAVGKYIYG